MIVYNITKIQPSIKTDWINWQKQEHIPEVMALSLENYNRYISKTDSVLRQKAFERLGN